MKIGDVVTVRYVGLGRVEWGIVLSVNHDGEPGWIQHDVGRGYVGWCDKATPLPGVRAQRAIVSSAVAAEALRRLS